MRAGRRRRRGRVLSAVVVRSLFASPLGGALASVLLVALVELIALGGEGFSVDPGATVVALHAALGLFMGGLVWLTEEIAARRRLGRWSGALVRALPAALPLAWIGRTLFGGASAAAMPGAAAAPIWVPVVGTLAVAAAIAAGGAILSRPGALRRALVAGGCLGAAIVIEAANRRLYRAEYPDLHAFLIPVSCALLMVAVLAAAAGGRPAWEPERTRMRIAAAVAVALVAAATAASMASGLGSARSRWVLATEGSHGRHLVRVVRDRFDRDGDGFSRALGGGDCDDDRAEVNPGAAEVAGNRIDEDCDGGDAAAPRRDPVIEARQVRAEDAFRDSAARKALLAPAARWNVLFISIDALRADAVTDTPENRKAFPNLFALFARSRRFDRAFSPSSGTDLSVSSAITGVVNPFRRIDTTLLEAVKRSGRATHAVLPREVLRYAGRNLLVRGLDRDDVIVNDGVQRDVSSHTSSAATTRRGLAALARMARPGAPPFLLWLHYFDVHEHLQIESTDPALVQAAAAGGFDLGTREGKYRALLAVTDRELGVFMADLERRGLVETTLVVLFSDHGESLGEDERLPDNHGLYLYHPLIHVVLAIHAPGGQTGADEEPVTLLDITPTVLELLGLAPLPDLAGKSLVPHLVRGAPAELVSVRRALPLNESDQWGVIRWPDKLLVRPLDNLIELYDLSKDPGERDDRAAREPALVRELKAAYQAFPPVSLDRTRKGREQRDRLALPPRRR